MLVQFLQLFSKIKCLFAIVWVIFLLFFFLRDVCVFSRCSADGILTCAMQFGSERVVAVALSLSLNLGEDVKYFI